MVNKTIMYNESRSVKTSLSISLHHYDYDHIFFLLECVADFPLNTHILKLR